MERSPSAIAREGGGALTTRAGDVTPGEVVLSVREDGVRLRDVRVRCEPGVLVSPSPPWSLQAH